MLGLFGFKDGYLSKWGGYLKSCEIGIYPDGVFRYLDISGQKMEFDVKDVTSVTLNQGGMGKSIVIINGSGTTLAATSSLPTPWALSLKKWTENAIREYKSNVSISIDTSSDKNDAFDALKKLKELKDLGIISENEYQAKREKMLKLI